MYIFALSSYFSSYFDTTASFPSVHIGNKIKFKKVASKCCVNYVEIRFLDLQISNNIENLMALADPV